MGCRSPLNGPRVKGLLAATAVESTVSKARVTITVAATAGITKSDPYSSGLL